MTSKTYSASKYEEYQGRCKICHKKITGKFWLLGNKIIICDRCYRKYPKCKKCGIPTNKPVYIDGKIFCKKCAKKLPVCYKCKKPVVSYWTHKYKGKKLIFCNNCIIKVVGKCSLCSKSLVGRKYWKIKSSLTGKQKKYCSQCRKYSHKCYVCGLLVKHNSKKLPGNRYICKSCRKTALKSKREYYKIFKKVDRIFKKKLGLRHKYRHRLHIVSLPILRRLKEKNTKNQKHINTDNLGLYVSKQITYTNIFGKKSMFSKPGDIYILDYLPKKIAYWIIAHEYAHAWYKERVFKDKGILITEGFAEWVSYHVLNILKLKRLSKTIMKNKSIYGKGARKILKYEKKHGYYKTLKYIQK